MVNYKLGILNNGNIAEFDLGNLISKKGSIEFIDNFTSRFNDELELKNFLDSNHIISSKNIGGKIRILYNYNGNKKDLPVVYKSQKSYIDFDYLRDKLRGLSSDIEFLKKLADRYNIHSKNNYQAINVSDIYIYISDVRSNGGNTFYSTMLNTALDSLFLKATTRLNNKLGEYEINYRGLRDLSIFVSNYEFKKELERKKKIVEFYYKEQKTYTIPNLNYDALDEPLFPPNSEEERKYIEYIESLPDEFSDIEVRMSEESLYGDYDGRKYK